MRGKGWTEMNRPENFAWLVGLAWLAWRWLGVGLALAWLGVGLVGLALAWLAWL